MDVWQSKFLNKLFVNSKTHGRDVGYKSATQRKGIRPNKTYTFVLDPQGMDLVLHLWGKTMVHLTIKEC